VFNGADLVCNAVHSALTQDYPNVEAVIADDASRDDTVQILRDRFGDSIRLKVSGSNRGQSRTANAAVAHSKGSLIKFLHHDDRLEPYCVSKMVTALQGHDSAGMAFSRRRVELDPNAGAAERRWLQIHGDPPSGFSSIQSVNSGLRLLREIIAGGFKNLIGEPSCVMVKRECLDSSGGFHPHIQLAVDLDLWLRIMARYDVVFIDEDLATYRHSPRSLTGTVLNGRNEWLDRLWILDTLASRREVRRAVPEVKRLWRAERRMAFRTVVRHALRPQPGDPPVGLWGAYAVHRIRRLVEHPV
jgi:glycosyltransferase involved in cell wall biosynthesis